VNDSARAIAHDRPLSRIVRYVLNRIDPSFKLEVTRRVFCDRSRPSVFIWSVGQWRAVRRWQAHPYGMIPPAAVKHAIIRHYARRFGTRVLVETGTFLGDTVYALRPSFDRIISIELDPQLAAKAMRRFVKDANVSILRGNSGVLLPQVLDELRDPALFWLDAHWSGGVTAHGDKETPVVAELELVLAHPLADHVVLVDDARLLGLERDYPTLDEIRTLVSLRRPDWVCELADDIVRLHARLDNAMACT